jgi:hypothetical protein
VSGQDAQHGRDAGHGQRRRRAGRLWVQRLGFLLLGLAAVVVVAPILVVVVGIVARGIGTVDWEFLSAMPRAGMKEGGILPAIVGTLLLTLGTALVAVPVGVGGAVWRVRSRHRLPGPSAWHHQPGRIPRSCTASRPGHACAVPRFGTSILAGSPGHMTWWSSPRRACVPCPRSFGPWRQPGRDALAGHPRDHPAAGLAGHHHRRDPGFAAGRREPRPSCYGGRLTCHSCSWGPDHGAALSPLRDQHPGPAPAGVQNGPPSCCWPWCFALRAALDPPPFPAGEALVEDRVS